MEKKVKILPLSNVEESLQILKTRLGRQGVESGTQVSIFILRITRLTGSIRSGCPASGEEIEWPSLGLGHHRRISQAVGSQFRGLSTAIRAQMEHYTATAHEPSRIPRTHALHDVESLVYSNRNLRSGRRKAVDLTYLLWQSRYLV
jgi:hypothetical protein